MPTPTNQFASTIAEIRDAGLYKPERVIGSPQGARVTVPAGAAATSTATAGAASATGSSQPVLNLCANNYLGLANHPDVVKAAHDALDRWGYGLASVRFICGTQDVHKQLEKKLSEFLGMEDTILYGSCFDANAGLFETLLDEQDAIISDELNHASIIDGVRLCKAQRFRYRNGDMADLAEQLERAKGARRKMIATDGVFSMDGFIAKLPQICDLAEKHGAMVMVDDSHAVGFIGEHGRGTHEFHNVMGRVDILTGTLGKALGGASGGYTSAKREIVELLRQRSRPYLFSNTVAPMIVGASIQVLDLIAKSGELRARLMDNTRYFRDAMTKAGFEIRPGEHPIVPIMLGDAALAAKMASMLLERGVYVIGFSYPVVPKGKARIRAQMSAAHSRIDLEFAVAQFAAVRKELS